MRDARVTRGDEIIMRSGPATYIPLGPVHRLKSPDASDLEMIEVQSGITSAKTAS